MQLWQWIPLGYLCQYIIQAMNEARITHLTALHTLKYQERASGSQTSPVN